MTYQLTPAEIAAITNAPDSSAALSVSGEIRQPSNAHYIRIAYIKVVLGARACGGFFDPTAANVRAKFVDAWRTAQDKEAA